MIGAAAAKLYEPINRVNCLKKKIIVQAADYSNSMV